MVSAIRHVGIVVSSIDKSIKFYYGLLNMKIVDAGFVDQVMLEQMNIGVNTEYIGWTKLKASKGDTLIELYHLHPPEVAKSVGATNRSASHIAFTVSDIKKAYKKLGEYVISKSIIEHNNHKLFFARDPDNNLLEFCEPPK